MSEGRRSHIVAEIARAGGSSVLDVHSDPDHNRSVLTLANLSADRLQESVYEITRKAVGSLDLRTHDGVHPRIGVVDVVPFVPLEGSSLDQCITMRDVFARWAAEELAVPCFLYGPERDLPVTRKGAFVNLTPDTGPSSPHPTAGAIAVGARHVLVAYNLFLATTEVEVASRIATKIRRAEIRSLGLRVGGIAQVSCNLLDPGSVGISQIYDEVSRLAAEEGTALEGVELVGLLPESLLIAEERGRWRQLGLSEDKTVEARMESPSRG